MSTPADPALAALCDEAAALCADPRLATLLHTHWPALGRGGRRVGTRIHPDDQMLLHSLRHHRDAGAAVSQYFNVALQQYHAARQIVDTLFPVPSGRLELLDFACGFGRLIRFLVACDRDVEITAAEIQPDALAFVGDEFGVATVPSTMAPEAFEPGRRFDVVWVASLFSHLPEGLFHRWLSRLHALLTPRGVLCFSVHDEVLAPPGAMPASGLLFSPHSENAALDADAYGTTYVTERFVRAAIARGVGARAPVHRIARALAHEQDVYVVAADPGRDLSPLAGFRHGPWGWVDERRVDAGALVLRGWAASLDDGALPAVTIRVDGTEHRCPTGGHRPDVRDVFGDERLAAAGWALRLALPEGGRTPWVEVVAPTPRGECVLLYAGWPGGPPTAPETPHVYRRAIDPGTRSSLSVIAALVAPGSRVLDVGTGSGALGRHLRGQRRCEVDGVTLSAAERDAASPAYDRLVVADLEDPAWATRFADRRYDVIVCADVLEHLREPARVLRACAGLLRDGGWLLASVPNVAYAGLVAELMHGRWTYGAEGLLDRTHLRFFTRASFRRLLEDEGWRVERIEPIDLTWYYTEFWTPFDRLPPTVARYLLAQPDASAYQLVFAARRTEAQARAGDEPLAALVPPPDPAVSVAVYASTLAVAPAGGGSARGVHALGRVGAQSQTLAFPIPADAGVPPQWRWYPADRPGYLHLHALRVRDRHGGVAWDWVAARDGDRALRDAGRQQIDLGTPAADGAVTLLLRGAEPGLDLPVPVAALAPAGAPWTFEAVCGWPLSADYLALLPAAPADRAPAPLAPLTAAAVPPPRDPVVEVVVPVHGQVDLVRRCLASVVDGGGDVPWHLTVIDDASPDAGTTRWLREFAAVHPETTVVANARNLGFVATANLGFRLAGRRDVVLLNSDTEVPPGWLDRLRRAAVADPRAGTVTPFSNNATICSFPRFCEDNPLPPGHTTASLDRLFAQTLAGQTVEIPTAVGFCMYIRRDCLDEIGDFDAATFGAGYGEENDFCLRATARGWRHLHVLDVFVRHEGGSSFGPRQQELQRHAMAAMLRLHPHYDELVRAYIERDPPRPYRDAVAGRLAAG